MLSIVICSVSPERLKQVSQNILDTVGVEYEIVAIDNRQKQWPITRAYNKGARQARYPFLFFVHEDVKFHSKGWGTVVVDKLKEPDCGVVGFAGSKVKLKCYSGWYHNEEWACSFFYQGGENGTRFQVMGATMERPFEEVVTIDGFGMFVRKEVWQQYPFDEELLTGFHCYDLDFSLQIAAGKRYKNYVCCSLKVLVEHSSQGSYDQNWHRETINIHKEKWNKILPLKIDGLRLGKRREQRLDELYFYLFLYNLLRQGYSPEDKIALKDFLAYRPCSWKHFRHCVSHILKYLRGN